MDRLARFLSLNPADRLFLLRCIVLVAIVRLGLSVLSCKIVRKGLVRPTAAVPATAGEIRKVAWGISRAARAVPRATCLTQALAGQILLSRIGRASWIRIGIDSSSPKRIEAHAWLVSGAQIVLGGTPESLGRYVPLTEFGTFA